MTQIKVPNAEPETNTARDVVRFSFSEAKTRLRAWKLCRHVVDDDGNLAVIALPLVVELSADEVRDLPEIGVAVAALMSVGTEIPKEARNTFKLGVGREFGEAKYSFRGTPGLVSLNATIANVPRVSVVAGKVELSMTITGTIRASQLETLLRYLSTPPKLTVEPPQQELDFADAGAPQ